MLELGMPLVQASEVVGAVVVVRVRVLVLVLVLAP